jgi:glycosyltransferase involved in cell wall biosynthesis
MQPVILCFCHLRWNFVYQRPQHLLSRFARQSRVYVIEDPFFDAPPGGSNYQVSKDPHLEVWIIEPHLEPGLPHDQGIEIQRLLLNNLLQNHHIHQYIAWYYSPMALSFSDHLQSLVTVYDCMDELSAFLHAPPALKQQEKLLMQRADIVFTGGQCLYDAKKHLHHNIHPFPSSIDKEHFAQARTITTDPPGQAGIPHPRIGFHGVIDERLDIHLLDQLALRRPQWQFVLVGPVVKIDPGTLPRHPNIHYAGGKTYQELPAWLAGWDIAMLPFALNESTRFISPTKTPEYLAGGKPVISTAIRDVIDPYGKLGLVRIANSPEAFINAAETILQQEDRDTWLSRTDDFLAGMSWDKTWQQMNNMISGLLKNNISNTQKLEAHV